VTLSHAANSAALNARGLSVWVRDSTRLWFDKLPDKPRAGTTNGKALRFTLSDILTMNVSDSDSSESLSKGLSY